MSQTLCHQLPVWQSRGTLASLICPDLSFNWPSVSCRKYRRASSSSWKSEASYLCHRRIPACPYRPIASCRWSISNHTGEALERPQRLDFSYNSSAVGEQETLPFLQGRAPWGWLGEGCTAGNTPESQFGTSSPDASQHICSRIKNANPLQPT